MWCSASRRLQAAAPLRSGPLLATPQTGKIVRAVVERTFAWLSRSRRLARDYERLPEAGEAMIHAAMSRIMLRRIAA